MNDGYFIGKNTCACSEDLHNAYVSIRNMEEIVYIKTPQGQAAAYDQTSAMPRKIRSLLKVIDGRTNLQVYVLSLHSFGDVQGLLASLQTAGLIRALSSEEIANTQILESKRGDGATKTSTISQIPRLDVSASSQPSLPNLSQTAPIELGAGSAPPDEHTSLRASAFAATQMRSNTVSTESSAASDLALLAVLSQMSDFVLVHAPHLSFDILKELEETQSWEQLAVLMGGYEWMLREIAAAPEHLRNIQARLKERL
jgi:hypothetical protein